MRKGLVGALMASTALLAAPALAQAQQYHYVKIADIDLPCPVGHGDIVTYDPTNQMVYVSLKTDGMSVIDSRTLKVVKTFKDIPRPNANYFDDNYVYVDAAEGLPQGMSGSNNSTGFGTVNQLVVIDKHTWQITDRIDVPDTTPDGLIVGNGKVYVDSDDNNTVMVYSAGAHPQLLATWPLYPYNKNIWWLNTIDSTGPDVAWLSAARHKLFQSDQNYMEILNSDTGAITTHVKYDIPLTGKGGTKGSWLDEKTNLLWVATTTKEGGLLVVNGDTLQETKRLPATTGKDQLSVDPDLGIVYTFGGTGFDAYDVKTMQHIAFVDTHVKTVHSGDVSDKNHEVFVYEGDRAAIGVYCPVPGPGPNGDWQPGVTCGARRAMAPAAMATGAAGPRELYLVFFNFNKSDITPAGRRVLDEALDAYRKDRPVRIEVTGYTDTVGSQNYNLGLSKRRADAAAAYLAQKGIPMDRMNVAWKGKEDLRVPTPNNVREPQNRRVEIVTP